jgi:hypothetical protein
LVLVVGTGWLLGGVFGVGTVLYAAVIGPLVQQLLPVFTVSTGLGRVHPAGSRLACRTVQPDEETSVSGHSSDLEFLAAEYTAAPYSVHGPAR